jgi:hypothetical protein
MDHVGFTVEDMQAFKADVDELIDRNPVMNTPPVGRGAEGAARLDLLKQQCPMGEYFLSDPDYTMIAVRERH